MTVRIKENKYLRIKEKQGVEKASFGSEGLALLLSLTWCPSVSRRLGVVLIQMI